MQSEVTLPAAVIFDMDGVLVDSNPFHVQKWAALLASRNIPFDRQKLPRQILGKRNDHVFRFFFGPELSEDEMRRMEALAEQKFREAFSAHAVLPEGLDDLLQELQTAGIPIALASSALPQNIEFILDALGRRSYFTSIMSGEDVGHPKPDPEIYIKTAERLGIAPAACVVFEDSFAGIEAAKAAGMKCIAIASTFPAAELREKTSADCVASGFREITLQLLRSLFNSHH